MNKDDYNESLEKSKLMKTLRTETSYSKEEKKSIEIRVVCGERTPKSPIIYIK